MTTVFMTGAGGGMGYESFKAMLPDIGKLYDLIILVRDSEKNRSLFEPHKDKKGLTVLCRSVLDLAKRGLREQGLGAEPYLEPLYRRAETLRAPARYMVEHLEAGTALEDLILQYAALDQGGESYV